jgi:hypothetical protein
MVPLLDCDIGELDPMPHTGFPRRNYGYCRRRLDLPKRRSLPGALDIIQGNMKSVVQDVIEVTDTTDTWKAPKVFRK